MSEESSTRTLRGKVDYWAEYNVTGEESLRILIATAAISTWMVSLIILAFETGYWEAGESIKSALGVSVLLFGTHMFVTRLPVFARAIQFIDKKVAR